MTDTLKIALAQLNPTVGDIDGNVARVRSAREEASKGGADLIVFSELFLIGYPPEDLVLKPAFQDDARAAVDALAAETADGGPGMLLPTCWVDDGKLHNAVALLDGGEIKALRFKHHLPNYGVFDEARVFAPGPMPGPVEFRGVRLGVPICEDIWFEDVVECLEETGAEILLIPNGSPFEVDKINDRMMHSVARVKESGLPLAYVNQLGGQDELIFDGGSFILNTDYSLALQMPAWEDSITLTTWSREADGWTCMPGEKVLVEEDDAAVYEAVTLALRDYVRKNGFPGVVLGMSGGIDSALSAAIAVDALGAENVHCVMMPSEYTSGESHTDAEECAMALGARYDIVSIKQTIGAFETTLADLFKDTTPDTTEENIQARIRGVILMALSNKFGSMVLTTGNKSEMSVGYATLYGDMSGGYNALKDVYKMQVFALSRWRNENVPKTGLGPTGLVIPENIIAKPPTAELRPDQKDQDSLPPYEELDDILECLVEREMGFEEIVGRGYAAEVVKKIEHLLYIAEYKRRQAPPGVKITSKNFGRDRRYPITNRYRDARD